MKKKVLLLIISIISYISFIPKTEAVVMWMQCTDEVDDKIGVSEDFYYYGSFAVINNKDGGGVKHLVYNSKKFYSGLYPTFILYHQGKDGTDNGNLCWYSEEYDSDQEIDECDENNYFIPFTDLLDGYCPTKIYDADDGVLFFGDTAGGIQSDMLILYGKKKAPHYETLNENKLVIYGFQEKGNPQKRGIIVESYYIDGRYSFGTTWKDFDEFAELLNMEINDDDNGDLIDEDEYEENYMNWTMQSQARRVGYAGKDYFKLTETQKSWLVGGRGTQELEVSPLDGKITVFKYGSGVNEGFGSWTSSWYNQYANELSAQIKILEKFEAGGEYYNLIKTSNEISDKIDEGKKYNFSNSIYKPEKMVEDLNSAYMELAQLINSEDMTYVSYNAKCEQDDKMTEDPIAAALTAFNCDVFGVGEIDELPHGKNQDLIDAILTSIISDNINNILDSDIGIESIITTAEKYIKLLAKSSNYIKKNIFFSDEEITNMINSLSDNYQLLVRDLGVEIVLDCETLIGPELRDEINSYLDIIKIVIPIILIGLGIVDFSKAMFSGAEDQMKKAQSTFIKRLGIAILIFLVPTIINLLLSLANKVWNFIEPSSCGLF